MAQHTLSGTINDTTHPLEGASIKIQNTNIGTNSNADGTFEIKNLNHGTYTLIVSYTGYQSERKKVTLSQNQVINFTLSPMIFVTNEVQINGTRASANSATTFKNINKENIEKNNFGQDLPFILNNTPNVVVTSDAGAGIGYTGIRIRGSDATRVNVTINGIPLNDSESQGMYWVDLPDFASSIDNIQIQRGVGSSTNGAGAFGGSLNIQTTLDSQQPYAELNNTYGSFNTLKNTIKIGTGLIDKTWNFDARLSKITSDGFIDRASSNLKSYFLSGAYHGKTDLLRINIFTGTEQIYQAWNGIPEAKLNGDVTAIQDYITRNYLSAADAQNILNANNRTYNSFLYNNQTDNYTQKHYQALYAKELNPDVSLHLALHYTTGLGYYEEFKPDQTLLNYGLADVKIGNNAISTTDIIRRRWLDNKFYGFTYTINYKANNTLKFTLGGAYNEYNGDHFGQIIWAKYASNSTIDGHYFDNNGFKTDFNIFGKINYTPTKSISLFADIQYRHLYYKILGTEVARNNLNTRDMLDFFNPKFGLTYLINPNQNIYASFSIANKEPSREDYVNIGAEKLPKSEQLNDIEIGYRYKKNALNINMNAYGMLYKNQLIITGKINDVGEYIRQNVPKSYRIGLEFDGDYTINKHLELKANAGLSVNKIQDFTEFIYNYDTNTQIENNYKNVSISFSPNTVLASEIVYHPLSCFGISLQDKYVGKQYLDNTQNENRKLNDYLTHNIRLSYNFSLKRLKNINISLLVNNILNEKYESNGYTYSYISGGQKTTENFYFPQSGTHLMMNLNLKF